MVITASTGIIINGPFFPLLIQLIYLSSFTVFIHSKISLPLPPVCATSLKSINKLLRSKIRTFIESTKIQFKRFVVLQSGLDPCMLVTTYLGTKTAFVRNWEELTIFLLSWRTNNLSINVPSLPFQSKSYEHCPWDNSYHYVHFLSNCSKLNVALYNFCFHFFFLICLHLPSHQSY